MFNVFGYVLCEKFDESFDFREDLKMDSMLDTFGICYHNNTM